MSSDAGQARGVYRITSIARPVDPAVPTNRAVLVVVPLAAALGAGLALAGLTEGSPGGVALTAALATFGVWALARDLAGPIVDLMVAGGSASCLCSSRCFSRGSSIAVPDCPPAGPTRFC